jgi:streptogramin lyase
VGQIGCLRLPSAPAETLPWHEIKAQAGSRTRPDQTGTFDQEPPADPGQGSLQPWNPGNHLYLFRSSTGNRPDAVGTVREMITHYNRPNDIHGPATQLTITEDGCLAWLPEGSKHVQLLSPKGTLQIFLNGWTGNQAGRPGALAVESSRNRLWILSKDFTKLARTEPNVKFVPGVGTIETEQMPLTIGQSGQSRDMAMGPGGLVWFTFGADGVVLIDGAAGKALSAWTQVPASHLAIAPDGLAWLACPSVSVLASVDPASNEVKTFFLPEDSRPARLAFGPRGLWFTDPGRNAIGLLEGGHAGQLHWFPLPTADSGPAGIALGPDGNLWFTQVRGNRIGRLTPAGELLEFTLPNPDGQPYLIVSGGKDGKLYFSHRNSTRMGSITAVPPAPPAKAAEAAETVNQQAQAQVKAQLPETKPAASQEGDEIKEEKVAPAAAAAARSVPAVRAVRPAPRAATAAPTPRIGALRPLPLGKILMKHGQYAGLGKSEFTALYNDRNALQTLINTAVHGNQYPLVGDPGNRSILLFHEFNEVIGSGWDRRAHAWVHTRRLVVALSEELDAVYTAYPVVDWP